MLQEQSRPSSCLSALRDGLIDGLGSAAQRGELGAMPSTGTSAPWEVRGWDPAQRAAAVRLGCPHGCHSWSGTGLSWGRGSGRREKVKDEGRGPEGARGSKPQRMWRRRDTSGTGDTSSTAGQGSEAPAEAEGAQIRAGCKDTERKAWSSLQGGKRGLEQLPR